MKRDGKNNKSYLIKSQEKPDCDKSNERSNEYDSKCANIINSASPEYQIDKTDNKSLFIDFDEIYSDANDKQIGTDSEPQRTLSDVRERLSSLRDKITKIVNDMSDDNLEKAHDLLVNMHRNSLNDGYAKYIMINPPNNLYYKSKNKGESAPEFIQRVYGNWLTGEFTRADLRGIDRQAEMGLRNWEKKNGRAPLNLPTKKERNDRLLAESNFEGKPEAVKLYDALRARKRRGRQNTP